VGQKINCFEQEVAEAAEKEWDRDGGCFGREEAQKSQKKFDGGSREKCKMQNGSASEPQRGSLLLPGLAAACPPSCPAIAQRDGGRPGEGG